MYCLRRLSIFEVYNYIVLSIKLLGIDGTHKIKCFFHHPVETAVEKVAHTTSIAPKGRVTSCHYTDHKNKNKEVNNMPPWQQPLPQEVIQQWADITFHFRSIFHTTAAAPAHFQRFLSNFSPLINLSAVTLTNNRSFKVKRYEKQQQMSVACVFIVSWPVFCSCVCQRLIDEQQVQLSQYDSAAGQCVGELQKARDQVRSLQTKIRDGETRNQVQTPKPLPPPDLHVVHLDLLLQSSTAKLCKVFYSVLCVCVCLEAAGASRGDGVGAAFGPRGSPATGAKHPEHVWYRSLQGRTGADGWIDR